ncbi:MAG TPA: hypothetical protein VJ808_08990 [Gemmatimonadales bacterium]|nr:hypothetical protein [Gemmatimonadales bacterium]
MSAAAPPMDSTAWRLPRTQPSLPESYRSISVPKRVSFWRKALAFAGLGYMVAVGYMDPGNWATDLAGGSRFVILLSNLMAMAWGVAATIVGLNAWLLVGTFRIWLA